MRIYTAGYSTRYNQKDLRLFAAATRRAITAAMRQLQVDTVVVTGNSGVSVGFAALALPGEDFPLVLVRKPADNSHGHAIEGPEGHRVLRYMIVDDFVESGDTVRRVVRQIACEAAANGSEVLPHCVGVFEYLRACGERRWESEPVGLHHTVGHEHQTVPRLNELAKHPKPAPTFPATFGGHYAT